MILLTISYLCAMNLMTCLNSLLLQEHSCPLSTLVRHFNLVTFTKFEPLERFKLTQLFVCHVCDTNVTHCVNEK